MEVKLDRREILPLIREHFKSLPANLSSDDVSGFLNAMTGLDVPLSEANGSAFDKWRMALAEQGYPVWPYSEKKKQENEARGIELKALEDARIAALPALLAELAEEAPGTVLVSP